MNELNHINGKGDKERSPGWRRNYDEINFPPATGFARRGNRLVKNYTPGKKAVFITDLRLPASSPASPPAPTPAGCERPGVACGDNSYQSWICTLPKGHAGDHIAHGCQATEPGLASWPQGEKTAR